MADKLPPRRPNPGANAGWAALSTLLAGMVAWSLIGLLLDWWLHIPNHLGLVAGMILGTAVGVYVVLKKYG
jgi:F0F1-type ATP synthase assembly protein I